jgi:glycosyltransferase involved in cell wall biosynthesis
MLSRASLVVALTDQEAEDTRRFGYPGRIAVIPNGVPPPPRSIHPDAFRASIRLSADARLAVFLGRLDVHRKGLDIALTGLSEAPGWHLALVGPSVDNREDVSKGISRHGLAERVHLVGERLGAARYDALAAADVFVLMSRWEGMSLALLEALSVGTPAIVSEAVERTMGVAAAGAGWVTPGQDLGALLRHLSRDPGQLRDSSPAALALSRRHGWDAVAEAHDEAYRAANAPSGFAAR